MDNHLIDRQGEPGITNRTSSGFFQGGGGGGSVNLALNKPAIQSSDPGWGGPASKAVDGNTDGAYGNGSVTHTDYDAQAWWRVDLGAAQSIQSVDVWNRTDSGVGDRLTNFNVVLLDANLAVVASVNVPGQGGAPTTVQISGVARYVKVQLVGTNYLSLAEVKVWGIPVPNLALNKTAIQSSDPGWGGPASKAVDSNTDGAYGDGSVTHTDYDAQAWWRVDLGAAQSIQSVEVWNRTDSGVGDRLTNFNVLLLNTNLNVVASVNVPGQGGTPTTVQISGTARYVKVQLVGTNYLSLAEVKVWAASSGSNASELAAARLDLFNQSGNQVRARDAEWSLPLLSLPGRAGLDLGLSLSYSSLVWTPTASALYFDADNGSPSPGFHLGFPRLQGVFYNSQAGVNARLLITSAGQRVELRQVNGSNYYEAADSSYLQLRDNNDGTFWLRTTDGTIMVLAPSGDEWHVTVIEDRNGNAIVANYNFSGDLTSVTDTLGRVIRFNYDGNACLNSITQDGRSQPWATFGWVTMTMHLSFGLPVVGAYDGEPLPVLVQVGLDDESRYNFDYTNWAQVNYIRRYTPDNVQRSYQAFDYDPPASDCPRLNKVRVWAQNWSDVNGVPHEVETHFDVNSNGTHFVIWPDQTSYTEAYGPSSIAWQKGLVVHSEVWSGGAAQKGTYTSWTQDNTAVNYQTNPRVMETNVWDAGNNHRRTAIGYYTFSLPDGASCSLPNDVYEYEADATTVARHTSTNYDLADTYLTRRIIGLVSAVYVSAPNQWLAKTSYGYDDQTRLGSQATTATMHDQGFDTTFTTRGNVTSVSRWNVNDINNSALTTYMNYNAAGSVLSTTDPAGHVNSIGYTDLFSDGNDRNTFAYPTTVTNADSFTSSIHYLFEHGAKTSVQGPPAAGQVYGSSQSFAYDSAARLERVTIENTGAYMRYVYGPNYTYSVGTINAPDDSYSIEIFDGVGQVFESAAYHPGSSGQYKAQLTYHDSMGRIIQQSNPTEVDSNLQPAGDDVAGWYFTTQTYDWKGRPLRTTHPDGYYSEVSYSVCGCAGSEVITTTDEAGRQTRTTNDVLGRMVKTEELSFPDANQNRSVYSTANYAYNARDQVTSVNHEGQVRSFGYDGYGRLQTRTTPEQGTTSYSYNDDGTTQSVTDARGASATYSYNNRHQVTGISYGVPYGVAATSNVSFGYDAAGNRISMSDGLGSASYGYDELSRLTSETRTFNGLGSYSLSYSYNLAGELTSITNPWNSQVGYGYDNMGKLTNVTGSGSASVSNYAGGISYRAWGAIKGMSYGDGHALSTAYDSRLRPTTWNVSGVLGYNYNYDGYYSEHTGRVTYAQSIYDSTLDRSYEYDQVGALLKSHSGAEARAHILNGQWEQKDGPYSLGFDYDQYGNMTHRWGWGGEVQGGGPNNNDTDLRYYYSNGKNQRDGFSYDQAGNLTYDTVYSYSYNAQGQQASAASSGYSLQQGYDGDGLRGQKTENGAVTYYIRSALGGQVIAEMDGSGNWARGYVYAGSELLAVQQNGVNWIHEDSVTKSKRVTDVSGNVVDAGTVELDPWGADSDRSSNAAFMAHNFTSYVRDGNGDQDAMARRYDTSSARFSQPDPYGGSYDFSDPQSLNRYAYTKNDPVNFRDPTGLDDDPYSGLEFGGTLITNTSAPRWPGGGITGFFGGDVGIEIEQGSEPGGGGGGGDKGDKPGPEPQGKANPNCFVNLLRENGGIGHGFKLSGDGSFVDHNGDHLRAPLGRRGEVVPIPAMVGLIKPGEQGDGLKYVDMRLATGDVLLLGDLTVITYRRGRIHPGQTLAYTQPGTASTVDDIGLHIALIRKQYYEEFNGIRRTIGAQRASTGGLYVPAQRLLKPEFFMRLNDRDSPVRCP